MLGVCSQDGQFIYIFPSWEGSAADGRVLRDAISRLNGLKVSQGQYYLVDAGYTNSAVFIDMESKASSRGGKDVWLPKEDAALVERLVELKITNKYVGDNGIKPDKATGKDAQGADNVNEEANHVNFEEGLDNVGKHQFAYDYENDDTLSKEPNTPRSRSSSGSRKKRKSDGAIDVLRDEIVTIEQSFQHATKKLCRVVHQLAHDAIIDERKEKLFEDLLKVQGLTLNEIYDTHMKLAQDSNLLVVFPTIPESFKAD
ncbi:hypothetical protein L6164_017066 [Bauhinia variegata]|uniref:Uncharacterized protein n=1 Tax=Bauhinia variegata TaxID=167791 RepID=A0ACB9N896_BAUVA|nr:hypothetical protein L6164_017066 [Bauhinia variegata]